MYRVGQIMEHSLNYKGVRSTLSHFPGVSCSVGISSGVYLTLDLRGKGLGSEAHFHRLQCAVNLGFKYLICSVRKDNGVQHKIMKKFGWKELDSTDTYCHNITVYGRDLGDIQLDPTIKEEIE